METMKKFVGGVEYVLCHLCDWKPARAAGLAWTGERGTAEHCDLCSIPTQVLTGGEEILDGDKFVVGKGCYHCRRLLEEKDGRLTCPSCGIVCPDCHCSPLKKDLHTPYLDHIRVGEKYCPICEDRKRMGAIAAHTTKFLQEGGLDEKYAEKVARVFTSPDAHSSSGGLPILVLPDEQE